MLFADKIRQLREENQLFQRQVSAYLEMDNAMYCKIERGGRRAKREQVIKLAELLHIEPKELLTLWLADQVNALVTNEYELANNVLDVVRENFLKY